MSRVSRTRWIVLAAAAALLAALLVVLTRGPATSSVTAEFDRTVGLFEGSDVRVMGLRVGHVEQITPLGTKVRVRMVYDADVRLPADVKAVVVAPSVISDRFVQLTPGYVSGPTLAEGAVIPERDTRVPVELDDSIATTTRLAEALGPQGANAHGALGRTLATLSSVLRGSGTDTRSALRDLADLSDTVAQGSPALASSLRHLARFSATVAASNSDVAGFNRALRGVASALGRNSTQVSALLRTLAGTLGTVAGFVRTNRGLLVRDVGQLSAVAKALTAERESLAEVLDIAPLAFTDLDETYDPQAQAVRTRANFGEVTKILDQVVCDALIKQAGTQIRPVCSALHQLLAAGAPR